MDELERLIAAVRVSLNRGTSEADINKMLAENTAFNDLGMLARYVQATKGELPTEFANRMAIEAVQERLPEGETDPMAGRDHAAAMRRLGRPGGSGAGDVGARLADEILFNMGGELFGDRFDQRVDDLRETEGTAEKLLVGGGAGLAQSLAPIKAASMGRGLAAKVLNPLAVGAGQGALYGLGNAEGSVGERLRSPEPYIGAGVGALSGVAAAAGGAALGATAHVGRNAIRRVFRGPTGTRLADTAARRGGANSTPFMDPPRNPLSRAGRTAVGYAPDDVPSMTALAREAADRTDAIRREVFEPLDAIAPDEKLVRATTALFQDPVSGPIAARAFDQTKPMSFQQLQNIHRALRNATTGNLDETQRALVGNTADQLGRAMDLNFPGYSQGLAKFARAKEVEEGFRIGYLGSRQSGRTSLDELGSTSVGDWLIPSRIEAAVETFSNNPEAQGAVRVGLQRRLMDELLKSDDVAAPIAQRMMDMQPTMRLQTLNHIFGDQQAARAFDRALQGSPTGDRSLLDAAVRSGLFQRIRMPGGG